MKSTGVHEYFSKDKIKQTAALAALVALGLFLLYALNELLVGTLGAIILYVLFKPIMQRFIIKKPNRKELFAILIILLSFLVILLPAIVSANLIYTKIYELMTSEDTRHFSLKHINKNLKPWFGYDIFSEKTQQSLREKVATLIPDLIGGTTLLVLNIVMMYFILFYMLVNTGNMEKQVNKLLPFGEENSSRFYKELENITFANALVVPLIAITQGLCTVLVLWISGVNDPVFWGFVTAVLSFVPFVGTALVWLPFGIFLLANNHVWQGIFIIASGTIIITHLDYVLRLLVQKRYGNVHPLVTILGIIAGLKLFSLPGVIFGPLLISYFIIFVKMYQNEYLHHEELT